MNSNYLIFAFIFAVQAQDCRYCPPGFGSKSICKSYPVAGVDVTMCGSDGLKYQTKCVFDCWKNCKPTLKCVGCGPQCQNPPVNGACPAPATTTTTTTIAPVICTEDGVPPCNVPPTPSCKSHANITACSKCTSISSAIGECVATIPICLVNTDSLCSVVDNCLTVPDACNRCTPESPAKGKCIVCIPDDIAPCNVAPTPSCTTHSDATACTKCKSTSAAIGKCV